MGIFSKVIAWPSCLFFDCFHAFIFNFGRLAALHSNQNKKNNKKVFFLKIPPRCFLGAPALGPLNPSRKGSETFPQTPSRACIINNQYLLHSNVKLHFIECASCEYCIESDFHCFIVLNAKTFCTLL